MTPTHHDLLTRELHRELTERASQVTGGPDLAGAVIARACGVRRRRTIGACATAVVVTAAVVAGLTAALPRIEAPTRRAAPAHTSGIAGSTVPTLADIPYALNRNEIHANGHVTHLPEGWSLVQMIRAGQGLVLAVDGPQDITGVAYVSPTGAFRRLPLIDRPIAVNPEGTVVVGSTGSPHDSTGTQLVEVSLPSGQVLHSLSRTGPGSPTLTAHNFGPDGSVLLDDVAAGPVWRWTPASGTVSRVFGLAPDDELLGAAPGGGYFALKGTGLVRTTATGATRWQVGDHDGGQRPILSPDGSQLVRTTQPPYRVSVIDATTGAVGPTLARVPVGPTYDGLRPPVWFDDSTVLLVVVSVQPHHGDQLFSCSLTARACTHLLTAPGLLTLGDRTWLSPQD